jgi:hypothetical protein
MGVVADRGDRLENAESLVTRSSQRTRARRVV